MSQFYHGKLLTTPMGPAGPDGNPIGTILSFLGLTPPKDYLVCDGSVLNIEDYPDLANFFNTQFGTKNHFGGDGETTFALPDMRNLFLRGWRGDAEEQLSGDVGAKQEGTEFPNLFVCAGNVLVDYGGTNKTNRTLNIDSSSETSGLGRFTALNIQGGETLASTFTSRPVNTAVLYCIKAVESIGYDANDYSLEEKRIGTWVDGKPLYRKVVHTTTGEQRVWKYLNDDISAETIAKLTFIDKITGAELHLGNDGTTIVGYDIVNKRFGVYPEAANRINVPITITIEYTKTTD